MPYKTIRSLPKGVKNSLPEHAQQIYKSAFNSAYQEHKSEDDAEIIAHRIAWAAVKQKYEKGLKGAWHKK